MSRLADMGPVIVGGGGGSGTRVVAQILQRAGFYMGRDLNGALDNRWFTLLFKQFGILGACQLPPVDQLPSLTAETRLLKKGMFGPATVGLRDAAFLLAKAGAMARTGHTLSGHGKGIWPYMRIARAMMSGPDVSRCAGWGFKEPNSHIFLPQLARAYPGMRYIHVMRHGLDMALSSNQQQLEMWGTLFGVDAPYTEDLPRKALGYWVRSNERALALSETLLPHRHLCMRFDELVAAPRAQIARLLDFIGQAAQEARLDDLSRLVERPESLGRRQGLHIDTLDAADIEAVRRLGFEVRR